MHTYVNAFVLAYVTLNPPTTLQPPSLAHIYTPHLPSNTLVDTAGEGTKANQDINVLEGHQRVRGDNNAGKKVKATVFQFHFYASESLMGRCMSGLGATRARACNTDARVCMFGLTHLLCALDVEKV